MAKLDKSVKEPLFHITKRATIPAWKSWLIRGVATILALLVCGIVCAIFTDGEFAGFYTNLFSGAFGTPRRIWNLFEGIAILLVISLAVTPAFKMKFWNIGAEGQVLMGALACGFCVYYLGDKLPNGVLLIVMLLAAIVVGAIWAVIPAIFKAVWNTNETLFTLMMNYIAIQLIACMICVWVPNGSGVIGAYQKGVFPNIVGGQAFIINILIVALVTTLVYIYLKYSKHGYELSVVGESENTARYIGINVKKVIIRTMILSGALCGLAGWLIVAGDANTLTTNIVSGRGFTAILTSWLAKFNPIFMVLTSFLVVFLEQGAGQATTAFRLGEAFPKIVSGIFFFFIIGCEFFINYQVQFRFSPMTLGLKIPKTKKQKSMREDK